jgi:hypothetical protein
MKHHVKPAGMNFESLDDMLYNKVSKLMEMSTMRCSSTYSHFFPKFKEPSCHPTKWDIILADAKLMKIDFFEEMQWKKASAYKFAHECSGKSQLKKKDSADYNPYRALECNEPKEQPPEKQEEIDAINEELSMLCYEIKPTDPVSDYTDKLHFEEGYTLDAEDIIMNEPKYPYRFDDEETTEENNTLLDYFTPEYHEIQSK